MIAMQELPHTVLSVSSVGGSDTIFRDTPLSKQLGLQAGDLVPSELAEADILLWVESAVLETHKPSPEELLQVRNELGMTEEQFVLYVGYLPRSSVQASDPLAKGLRAFFEGGCV